MVPRACLKLAVEIVPKIVRELLARGKSRCTWIFCSRGKQNECSRDTRRGKDLN